MGRIADIPNGYWITCVELGRANPQQMIVPGVGEFLDELLAHPVADHDPLLSRWKISVTKIDSRLTMGQVQTQFRRDGNSFEIQKSFDVDLRELAQQGGFGTT